MAKNTIILLALVQGITEFLPVSSSAHLILLWEWFESIGWNMANENTRLVLDIAMHVGTLFAVILYFWRDCWQLFLGGVDLITFKLSPNRHLFMVFLVASIPVVIVGFFLKDIITYMLRTPMVIGITTLIFGILLWWVDKVMMTLKRMKHLGFFDALILGFAQCFALVPGVSRSGIVITAGRFISLERASAARISSLMAIPTILGAGTLGALDLYKMDNLILSQQALWATVISMVVALLSIHIMMMIVRRMTFLPFVLYRVGLSVAIFAVIFLG